MDAKPLAIPDIRFEQTFMVALKKEALKQHQYKIRKLKGSQDIVVSEDFGEPTITTFVVAKVIVRDVVLLPLVHGMLWTGFLIMMKPWLKACTQNGRRLGAGIYNVIVGRNVYPKPQTKRI
ncbi:uncharacterized protein Ecym_4381 [Eremothecium cymbalariae DBVPG|uniref:Uncharacterized protein n=1 Tax=Eremothecium cymbalariae (strain CBS 270.75 / DBVPG 7215 / KCTC 17166 / NRRL Y-17582) TaxID=931890 RepID=G8JTT3_ERECY|nr:hypothetical protein Ecym_4381 [Eremothecium cymbalariae DBVPG\